AAYKYSATDSDRVRLNHPWQRSVVVASQMQHTQPQSGVLYDFLMQPCRATCTSDGELALEFGAPPLVVLSSDAQLLPIIRRHILWMRWMRRLPLEEPDRIRLTHMHRAAWLLVDALEQLQAGLPGVEILQ